MTGLRGAAAIAGIGATEFSKESGRSELQLACEAVSAALDDAGIAPGEVDGMVTFTAESSSENHVARNVGIGDLTFFSRVGHGGGAACGTVAHAVAAITAGLASVVGFAHRPSDAVGSILVVLLVTAAVRGLGGSDDGVRAGPVAIPSTLVALRDVGEPTPEHPPADEVATGTHPA